MLLSFESGDAKGSIIIRRAQRPRGDIIDIDEVSQVYTVPLIAEIGCFVFDSLFHGEPVRRFSVFCFARLQDEL